jgi:UDP-N-acetylglucosamine--N-acetylmuramyl-(pentapeptide) pyrophosphoryl-undecaprenol N-acetylglucosamine transferase
MRYLFTGGGTMGSVTPLLATIPELQRLDAAYEGLWVCTKTGPEAGLLQAEGMTVRTIASGKLRRYFSLHNLTDLFRILVGFGQAWRLLGEWRPDVVVTAGSFVAVPVVWAAALRRVPVHVHQLDIRPGLANKLAAPFAKSLSVSFEKSVGDYAKPQPVWTGNPVRAAILGADRAEAARFFELDLAARPTVLVLGGGTGAVALNELVALAVPQVDRELNLIHLTGRGKQPAVPPGHHNYRAYEYLHGQMGLAFAAADLVVTRAGMGTLTELAALQKPTVIVPMPSSHQEDNAVFFEQAGAAETWDERQLTPGKLAGQLIALTADAGRRQQLGQAIGALTQPNSAARLAAELLAAAR